MNKQLLDLLVSKLPKEKLETWTEMATPIVDYKAVAFNQIRTAVIAVLPAVIEVYNEWLAREVVAINIAEDNGDIELGELRFREKIIILINNQTKL